MTLTTESAKTMENELLRIAEEMHVCAHSFTVPTRKAVDVWAHDLYAAVDRARSESAPVPQDNFVGTRNPAPHAAPPSGPTPFTVHEVGPAPPGASVGDDLVLAPRNPTSPMLMAVHLWQIGRDSEDDPIHLGAVLAERIYKAMLAAIPTPSPSAERAPVEPVLGPIESNEFYKDRFYIPLPGGWEIQTKGSGSSFRICDQKSGERYPVCPQPYLYEMLEKMGREIHAAWNARTAPPPDAGTAAPVVVTDEMVCVALDSYAADWRSGSSPTFMMHCMRAALEAALTSRAPEYEEPNETQLFAGDLYSGIKP